MTQAQQSNGKLDYCGIRCTTQGLDLYQDRRVYRHIEMDHIRRVTARNGLISRHPVLQLVCSGALMLLGLAGTGILLSGDPFGLMKLGGGCAIFGLLGVWLLLDALRRGHYLIVETFRRFDRCPFTKDATGPGVTLFLLESSKTFALPAEISPDAIR